MINISVLDVLYNLATEFNTLLPTSNNYFGNLKQKTEYPCFLYTLVFNKDTKSNYYTKNTTLDLQIIYFSEVNEDDEKYYESKLLVMDKLKEFLSTFNLQAGDRNINFEYDFGEADGQLTINIMFKFTDEVMLKQESYDLMEEFYFATKIND